MSNNPNKIAPEFYIARIDEMLESGEYVWAEETLMGIRENIEENNRFTRKQVDAIFNIRRSTR